MRPLLLQIRKHSVDKVRNYGRVSLDVIEPVYHIDELLQAVGCQTPI